MACCVAWNCSNRKSKGKRSFHKFPKNEERRKEWIAALRRDHFQATEHSMLCADHFEESCFDRTGQTTRLRDTAVPTIFDFPSHLQKVKKSGKVPAGRSGIPKSLALFSSPEKYSSGAAVVDDSDINRDYQIELRQVKQELQEVEGQLQELLTKQSRLLERKIQLETVLQNQAARQRQDADTQWDNTDFSWSTQLDVKLQSVFRMTKLRPMQRQAMNATLSGRDCLLIMPTGGGKSLCFQLPALLAKGITVVVSPLVSLMEDQVMNLRQFDIEAVILNANTDKTTVNRVQDAMIDQTATLRLIYVTPEKLAKSKRFMNRLEKMYEVGRFARLVIDEVHCCSQWGHDFRPDYKFLGIMKRQFPDVVLLGLTATATVRVLEDVKKILNIPHCLLLKSSFNRPNLYYQHSLEKILANLTDNMTIPHQFSSLNSGHKSFIGPNMKSNCCIHIPMCYVKTNLVEEATKEDRIFIEDSPFSVGALTSIGAHAHQVLSKPPSQEETIDDISDIISRRFPGQSGIIYCFSQKESEEVSAGLQQRGIQSQPYHASLPAVERSQVHQLWASGELQVIVATVAFGMGIDKPDVRFVIHHSLSKSTESMYQESGRAGRDGENAYCIVFYRLADVVRQSTMVFTERTGLENLYGIVAYCIGVRECRRAHFARHFGEAWDSNQCDGMCDHCDKESSISTRLKQDVTRLCQDIVKILNNAAASKQRVTAAKVLDAWYGKGSPSLRLPEVKAPAVTREKAERIFVHLLLEGFIREDFHFTAYSTICYFLSGSRAQSLLSGATVVTMEFPCKKSATSSSTSDRLKATSSSTSDRLKATSSSTSDRLKAISSSSSDRLKVISSSTSDRLKVISSSTSDRLKANCTPSSSVSGDSPVINMQEDQPTAITRPGGNPAKSTSNLPSDWSTGEKRRIVNCERQCEVGERMGFASLPADRERKEGNGAKRQKSSFQSDTNKSLLITAPQSDAVLLIDSDDE